MIRRWARRPLTWMVVAVVLGGAAFGLYWFTPWKLFTSSTVHDALPVVVGPPASPSAAPTASPSPTAPADQAVLLAEGKLITHEHQTSGQARLVRLADGRVQLLLVGLATSDGPDLRVWLTDQRVTADGWSVFDDGRYVELGPLKATHGDQVYDLPRGTAVEGLTSVTIWCKRFSVSFGAASLRPA